MVLSKYIRINDYVKFKHQFWKEIQVQRHYIYEEAISLLINSCAISEYLIKILVKYSK